MKIDEEKRLSALSSKSYWVCRSKITMLFIYILLFSQLKKKKDYDILTLINLY